MHDKGIIKSYNWKKLVIFTPNDFKKKIVVIPFGSKNTPSYYTAIMENFQRKRDIELNYQFI